MGSHLSQATKDKISAALRGRHPSATHRAALSAAMKGRVMLPETKAKIAAAMHLYRLAHPDFVPARGSHRSNKEKRRQRKFMKGNKYAYKPHLHMTQEQMQKGFDDYVKLHGKKPYPTVLTREEINERLAISKRQIEERLVPPESSQERASCQIRKGVNHETEI